MARLRTNFRAGLLSADLGSGATSMSSAELATLPVVSGTDFMMLTLDPLAIGGAPEIVKVTAHMSSGTTATIVRAQEGTSARSHSAANFLSTITSPAWRHAATAVDFVRMATFQDFGCACDGTTDDSVGMQAALTAQIPVRATPGSVLKWVTALQVPKNMTTWAGWYGHGATLKPSGTMTKCFAPDSSVSIGDTIGNWGLEGFAIDMSAYTGAAPTGAFCQLEGTRINHANLVFRQLHGTGLVTDTTETIKRWWFLMWSDHTADGLTQTTAKDILFEDVHLEGGVLGASVAGNATSPYSGPVNHLLGPWGHPVRYVRCEHICEVVAPTSLAHNNWQMGGRGWGQECSMDTVSALGGTDANIEINAIQDFTGTDITVQGSAGACIYHTNYHDPPNPAAQRILLNNPKVINDADGPTEFFGIYTFDNGHAGGTVEVRGYKYYCRATRTLIKRDFAQAEAMYFGQKNARVLVDGYEINLENFMVDTDSYCNVIGVYNQYASNPIVEFHHGRIRLSGTYPGGSVAVVPVINVQIADGWFFMDGTEWDVDITGLQSGRLYGVWLGGQSTSKIDGWIKDQVVKQFGTSGDVTKTAELVKFDSSNLTIPSRFTVSGVRAVRFPTASESFVCAVPSGLVGYIRANDLTSATNPKAVVSVSPSGSPFAWQNTTAFAVDLQISSGTVSAIEHAIWAPGGSPSYLLTGVTQGEFRVRPGEWIRVTYTGAPNMRYFIND